MQLLEEERSACDTDGDFARGFACDEGNDDDSDDGGDNNDDSSV